MHKWYAPAKFLVLAAFVCHGTGCASTGRTVAGWFGRDKDVQTAQIDKEPGKSKSSTRKKPTAKSTQEELADADDAIKSSKKSTKSAAADKGTARSSDLAAADSAKPSKKPTAKRPVEADTDDETLASTKPTSKIRQTSGRAEDPFLDEANAETQAQAKPKVKAAKAEEVAQPTPAEELAALSEEPLFGAKKPAPNASKAVKKTAPPVGKTAASEAAPAWEEEITKIDAALKASEDAALKKLASLEKQANQKSKQLVDTATETAANEFEETKAAVTKRVEATKADLDWDGLSKKASTAVAVVGAAKEAIPHAKSLLAKCPEATGELKQLVASMETGDIEVLKRNVHRVGQMAEAGRAAAPALRTLLKHNDPYVRIHSALALSRMKYNDKEVLGSLVQGLKSTDAGVRSFSAACIGELGPQAAEALPALATALTDSDPYVRLHVAEVLVRYPTYEQKALSTLAGCLDEKDQNIRWLATYSLAELKPQRTDVVVALTRLLSDPEQRVRVGAIYALGEIGPLAAPALPELQEALTDPNADIRAAAAHALQQVRG